MANGLRRLIRNVGKPMYNQKVNSLTVSQARQTLRELVDKVTHDSERIVLSRYGEPAAALVSVEDLELLELLEDREDLEAVKEILKNPKMIPWDKAKKKLGL